MFYASSPGAITTSKTYKSDNLHFGGLNIFACIKTNSGLHRTRSKQITSSPLKGVGTKSRVLRKRKSFKKHSEKYIHVIWSGDNFRNSENKENVKNQSKQSDADCPDQQFEIVTETIEASALEAIETPDTVSDLKKVKTKKGVSCQKKSATEPATLRRSQRKRQQVPSYRDLPNNRKPTSIDTMPGYDQGYPPTGDTITNGSANGLGKYANGRGHASGSSDAYYGNGTDSMTLRQQMNEIASSMASLCNIGNSCYMNSVIYTLRFTPMFLHSLHHLVNDFALVFNRKESQQKLKSASLGRNVNGLQGQNARSYSSKDLVSLGASSPAVDITKTTQQKAAEKLHELFKSLSDSEASESNEPYQADNLLKAIQDVSPIFEGNQQQDAHEFLMCILDSIRESCQTLIKTLTDNPDIISNG